MKLRGEGNGIEERESRESLNKKIQGMKGKNKRGNYQHKREREMGNG